jgi:polynucleotide 5'-kinase involved in rRNA processing
MLAGYFRNAGQHVLSLRRLAVYELERLAPGALLALQDAEGFSLGLGAVERIDSLADTIVVRTQVANLEGVHSLRFGSQRWDFAGQREI